MIKIKTIKGKIEADIIGARSLVQKEIIATNIYLTRLLARATSMSFESAALFLMQQSTLANKQAMEDLGIGIDKINEGEDQQ